MRNLLLILSIFLSFVSCRPEPEPEPELPTVKVLDSRIFEKVGNNLMTFEVRATGDVLLPVEISYSVSAVTAEPGVDFVDISGTVVMDTGQNLVQIQVEILDDVENEVEEKLILQLDGATNATIADAEAIGLIQDNDDPDRFDAEGYWTPNSFYGYNLVWGEEFDGNALDTDAFNYEYENGCPNLCGWGNDELQWYTDLNKNIKVEDGLLTITATKEGVQSFHSARIQTKGKKEFQFGRIDIRARLPIGQGIWPALWMLGQNIDDVSWPACGEIDIMEMVGHEGHVTHGTAHWGPQGRSYSTFKGSAHFLTEDYIEKFHVFSLIWEAGEINWYVDETRFHTITPDDMQGEAYPFNQPFFFVLNVAVGGIWPGNPDATTVFPQKMEIDYIRVFQ